MELYNKLEEILSLVTEETKDIIKELLCTSKEDTDRRIEEHRKRRETFNEEYQKDLEYMKH